MTALADACAELAAWLPAAEALITAPDTQGSTSRGQPSSRPPWNAAAAMALLDALEGVRRLEASWRSGVLRPYSATGAVLQSIVRLSCAVTEGEQQEAVVLVRRWTTPILQLPAIDKDQRWEKIRGGDCPYCEPLGFTDSLRWKPSEGKVACFRGYAALCTDSDGYPPTGLIGPSELDGTAVIKWRDGLVT